MRKNIKISIPLPCNENWDSMGNTEKGKFCKSCQKEVIDFTTMSDVEICNYIRFHKKPFCGSFDRSQLNRPIVTSSKSRNFNFKKIAASIIAILSFKLSSSQSTNYTKPYQFASPPKKVSDAKMEINSPQEYIITGTVSAMLIDSMELSRVVITIGNEKQQYYPDNTGRYKIILNESDIKEYTVISFFHPGLLKQVRTIHRTNFPAQVSVRLEYPTRFRLTGLPALEN
jgi:hypothetical protein